MPVPIGLYSPLHLQYADSNADFKRLQDFLIVPSNFYIFCALFYFNSGRTAH
jgi:hypothetical protein